LTSDKLLEQLRVTRALYRIPLTDIALVSGVARWRVQEIFAGTFRAATQQELRVLRRALAQLEHAARKKKALLDNHRKAAARA
jgi:hypothetical protein